MNTKDSNLGQILNLITDHSLENKKTDLNKMKLVFFFSKINYFCLTKL